MKANTIIAGLLGTSLLATAAIAQSPATTNRSDTMATSGATSSHMGQWRGSKLVGINVYNRSNENLGDINDLLIDNQGRIQGVVIGVGGFLGVGQRDVMVAFDKLQWVDTPVSSNTAMNRNAPSGSSGSTTTTGAGTTTTGSAAGSTSSTADRWYPDHAVLNVSKDELKSMPEFSYSSRK